MPLRWTLRKPSEWIAAAADAQVEAEFRVLEQLIGQANPLDRELLIRETFLWRSKEPEEVLQALRLADQLSPGCAQGRHFRMMAGQGVDSKFFERHTRLLTRLLDERYQGAASEQGLAGFLDAQDENDHWILLVPLTPALLPFQRLKVSTRELAQTHLPAARLLVIENEQCVHLLPALPDTLALLGAGLDLQWLGSPVFDGKQLAYWGDMDTWGLKMLGRARQLRPATQSLLMSRTVFERDAAGCAVKEPVPAQPDPPAGLNSEEQSFYRYLLAQEEGRLEQEFLPQDALLDALAAWVDLD